MSIFTTHPFIVHFALSLALLAAMMEAVPWIRARIPDQGRALIWKAALLSVVLAVLSGWLALEHLEKQNFPLPRLVGFHRLAGISGFGLLLILWAVKDDRTGEREGRSRIRQDRLKKTVALVTMLLFLATATMGGRLVYHDHLGTDFRSSSGPEKPWRST